MNRGVFKWSEQTLITFSPVSLILILLFCFGYDLLHSPREIISTAGKTGHDARWKRKQS